RLRMFDGFTVSRGDECPYLVHGDIALGEVAEGLRGDWYSVANNSASRLAGPRVSGVSASGAARAIRSDSWGVGGASLRVLPGGEFLGLSELGNFPSRVRELDLEERSEERRVGKEYGARWAPEDHKEDWGTLEEYTASELSK